MNRTIIKISLFFLALLLVSSPPFCFVAAQTDSADPSDSSTNLLNLQVPIFDYAQSTGLPQYIFNIFKYSMIIIVVLAIIMVMWGGIQWIAAAGNSQKINAAKKQISSAFLGLILGLLTYTLLSFVGITQLYMPGVIPISKIEGNILEGEFDNDVAGGGGGIMSEVPHIYQGDYKGVVWDGPGCHRTVSGGGCGLVSTVMVIKYYGKNITVEDAAKWTVDNKWRKCPTPSNPNRGITYEGIAALGKHYGLNFKQLQTNFETLKSYATNKKPVIILVHGPCKFTQGGHFIVLAGWDAAGNRFIVNDPGSHKAERTWGTWAEISQGCQLTAAGYVGP